jgi:hypothetical protein
MAGFAGDAGSVDLPLVVAVTNATLRSITYELDCACLIAPQSEEDARRRRPCMRD